MEQLFWGSLPFVVPAMLPILAVLWSPLLQKRARTLWAGLLGLVAIGLMVDVLIFDHGHDVTLEVPSVFGRGPESELHVWTVDTVTAPVWQWHVAAAVYFGIVALCLLAMRGREQRAPRPVLMAVFVFVYALAARLVLEKTAAPVEIVWALGTSAACFAISLFFGWYAGARGLGFGRFVKAVVIANVIERVLLVTVSFLATRFELGTHLDVHVVTDITPPGMDEIVFETPTQAWLFGILVPNLTFALLMTILVGIVLGLLPWWLAGRRTNR